MSVRLTAGSLLRSTSWCRNAAQSFYCQQCRNVFSRYGSREKVFERTLRIDQVFGRYCCSVLGWERRRLNSVQEQLIDVGLRNVKPDVKATY
jgi:hypothetical protein